jgi:hypothetical protein
VIDAKTLPRWMQRHVLKLRMAANAGHLYILKDKSIKCLCCGSESYSREDMRHLFCLRCGFYEDIERELFVNRKNPYAA